MLYYIISPSREQLGPFTAEQLLEHGLTLNSIVWTEGLPDWVAASSIPELRQLIEQHQYIPPMPPPINPLMGNAEEPKGPAMRPPYPSYGMPQAGPDAHSSSMQQSKPDSYMALSILATLLCCLPFGIVAIIAASKVDTLWNSGKHEEARRASRAARNWVIISAITAVVLYVFYFAFSFFTYLF